MDLTTLAAVFTGDPIQVTHHAKSKRVPMEMILANKKSHRIVSSLWKGLSSLTPHPKKFVAIP
jgi:hypothetical protein